MIKIINIMLQKVNPEPSIEDIKEFSMSFSKEQWGKLTLSKRFNSALMNDMREAKRISIELLNKL